MGDVLSRLRRLFSSPVFSIELRGGRALLRRGSATGAFVRDCSEIASSRGIDTGWIWGTRTSSGGIRLEFSRRIPQKDRQRFRNALGLGE